MAPRSTPGKREGGNDAPRGIYSCHIIAHNPDQVYIANALKETSGNQNKPKQHSTAGDKQTKLSTKTQGTVTTESTAKQSKLHHQNAHKGDDRSKGGAFS